MGLTFIGKIFRGDKVIWGVFIALCIISLLEVFSATSTIAYRHQNYWSPILRHATFLFIGFAVVVFLQRVPSRFYSILILGVPLSAFLLLLTMVMGAHVNGAQRWLGVGAFTIQPSEFAKISAVGYTAFFLAKLRPENEKLMFKIILIGIGILCVLIVSENLSTATLLFVVCFIMMFIGQMPVKKIVAVLLVIFACGAIFIGTIAILPSSFTKNHLPGRVATWKARFERHSNEKLDADNDGTNDYKITDDNYQVSHAKIAIANGGIIGLPGSGNERDFLPQAYSDFIFAIILEETGLVGGLIVLLLYIVLMIRTGILASKCDKKFPRYLLLGSALMLTIQALINMSVAVNLIPVTGQPLPLISRGGTSTIITCAYFGIILACSSQINSDKNESFDHEDVDESIANVAYPEENTEINETV